MPEEVAVEAPDVIQEGPPPGHRPARDAGLGVVVGLDVPAVVRDLGDQVATRQQRLPQFPWRVDTPGQAACHADHGDRCGG